MGRGGLSTGRWIALFSCGFVWLIITIGLLAGSFSVLTQHEYGLKFNSITVQFDDSRVYTAGRHYVGVGGSFFRFPRKLSYVEFSTRNGRTALDVWSKDGQSVFVEASFYYKLREDRIVDLFYTFGTNFQPVVTYMAAETIRDVATTYNTIDFFTNRSAIDDQMSHVLSTRLYLDIFANVTQFNLLSIDVPDGFEAAVADKVVTAQEVRTLETLRASQLVRTEISVLDATATGNITVLNAEASARGLLITKSTEATLLQSLYAAKAHELSLLAADLNFTSPTHLLQYLNTDVIRGRMVTVPTVAVGVTAATTRA